MGFYRLRKDKRREASGSKGSHNMCITYTSTSMAPPIRDKKPVRLSVHQMSKYLPAKNDYKAESTSSLTTPGNLGIRNFSSQSNRGKLKCLHDIKILF